jgi:hypothetical protein
VVFAWQHVIGTGSCAATKECAMSGREGVSAETLRSISTPDRVESRLRALEFRDGAPSRYLMAMRDSSREYLDGSRSYRLTLPPEIPESRFWSVMLNDRQTRAMLQTGQPKPDVGSQSGTVETNPDGSTDISIGLTPPDGEAGTWIQAVPDKGFFAILWLYNPLQPFFDKTWRPSEIEPI